MLLLIVLSLIGLAILINLFLIARPGSTHDRNGKMLAFVGIFLLPILTVIFGTEEHMEKAKQTEFCLSCHAMEPYGKSLLVDDDEFIPAQHFQNDRIPREEACYTCHTDYTMFGPISAKIKGINHVLVQFLGTVPDTIHLYDPYSNRQCLHCHAGSRSFEENEVHTTPAAFRDSLANDQVSCLTSGCHDVVHNVHELSDYDMWTPQHGSAVEQAVKRIGDRVGTKPSSGAAVGGEQPSGDSMQSGEQTGEDTATGSATTDDSTTDGGTDGSQD